MSTTTENIKNISDKNNSNMHHHHRHQNSINIFNTNNTSKIRDNDLPTNSSRDSWNCKVMTLDHVFLWVRPTLTYILKDKKLKSTFATCLVMSAEEPLPPPKQ